MQAIIDAPPTIDTLTWEEAITIGSQAIEHAEQSKWDLGDIANIVAHKWHENSLKSFAESIGMHDNPKRIYEFAHVAAQYPKSARALYPKATWSVWRECARHGLTPDQSLEMMALHSEKPVAKVRAVILGTPDKPRTVLPQPVGEFGAFGFDLKTIAPTRFQSAIDENKQYRVVVYVDDTEQPGR